MHNLILQLADPDDVVAPKRAGDVAADMVPAPFDYVDDIAYGDSVLAAVESAYPDNVSADTGADTASISVHDLDAHRARVLARCQASVEELVVSFACAKRAETGTDEQRCHVNAIRQALGALMRTFEPQDGIWVDTCDHGCLPMTTWLLDFARDGATYDVVAAFDYHR